MRQVCWPVIKAIIDAYRGGKSRTLAQAWPPIEVDEESFVADVLVYPNPTDGKFTIEYETEADSYIITLSDAFGKTLLRRKVSEQMVQFDLNGLPSGTYLLTIEDGSNKVTKKVIKN